MYRKVALKFALHKLVRGLAYRRLECLLHRQLRYENWASE